MGDTVLRLVPEDPHFVPDETLRSAIPDLIARTIPRHGEVEIVVAEHVQFVDPAENFARVECPRCDADLDLRSWWRARMCDEWDRSLRGFTRLEVVTPCCGEPNSLNDLRYIWPAGFARFCVSVWNPEIPAELWLGVAEPRSELGWPRIDLAVLARALGCDLRAIWAHP